MVFRHWTTGSAILWFLRKWKNEVIAMIVSAHYLDAILGYSEGRRNPNTARWSHWVGRTKFGGSVPFMEAEVARIQRKECQRGGNSKKNDLDICGWYLRYFTEYWVPYAGEKNAQGLRGNHWKGIGRITSTVHTELTIVHLPTSQSRKALWYMIHQVESKKGYHLSSENKLTLNYRVL